LVFSYRFETVNDNEFYWDDRLLNCNVVAQWWIQTKNFVFEWKS